MFKLLIPVIGCLSYRLGGWGKYGYLFLPFANPKLWRWLMGIPIALITGNWWYALTYFIATNVFSYGENHPLTRLLGRFNWLISGFMLGFSSLSWINALVSSVSFYILMHLSNTGIPINSEKGANDWLISNNFWKLDHKYVELGIGLITTLIFLFK